MARAVALFFGLALSLVGCGNDDDRNVKGYEALAKHVEGSKVGGDIDQWIEMKNMAGEWERTGLIFGYLGDYDECVKAIDGLKRANQAREYRCVPAQR